jgi:DNA-directed RNA polymerase specialized sigma24 family protein
MSANAHEAAKEAMGRIANGKDVETSDLAAAWPELQRVAIRELTRRGATSHLVDEIVQETALRLLGCWDRLDHSRPLAPLVAKIASNCLKDHYRRIGATPLSEIPDEPANHDVEDRVLARARLRAAGEAMEQLRHRDRSLLLAEIGIGTSQGNRMARSRARQRLQAIVERTSAAFSMVSLSFRRMMDWINGPGAVETVGAVTTAGVFLVVSLAALVFDSGRGAQASPHYPEKAPVTGALASAESPRLAKAAPRARTGGSFFQTAERAPTVRADESAPDTREKDVRAGAGPASAEKGHGQGYVYVRACIGEDTETEDDDWGVVVVVMDGNQNGEEEAPACRQQQEDEDDD